MIITARVDEYVELLGVILYLRGDISYKNKSEYMKDVDQYFRLYKKHPIIKKNKKIEANSLIYISILIEYKRGKFILRKEKEKNYLLPKDWLKELFENSDEILKLITDFYKTSCFHSFFEQHKAFYTKICSYYNDMNCFLNTDWFKSFLGYEDEHLFSIIPMSISRSVSYGLCRHIVNQPRELVAILCEPNFSIDPIIKKQSCETFIVHEYLHSFINPLLYSNEERQKKLQADASKLLEYSKWIMRKNGYDEWRIFVNEYLVRAVTNIYMQDNKFRKQEIEDDIVDNIAKGFYLMPELVGYLNKYRYCRDKFKTFSDFYSEIIKFFSLYAKKEIKRVDDIVNVILDV